MKRLFIAVDVDAATRRQIERISSALRERVRDVKASWVRAERMHLTLIFFGEADSRLEQRLHELLSVSIDEPPFEVSFEGIGAFPSGRRPRVLWLGIRAGLEPLRRLQGMLAQRLGLPHGETEVFTPHLTLARLRPPSRDPAGPMTRLADIPASAGPTRIDRVTLYESRPSAAGSTYVHLAEAPLEPWKPVPSSS